MKLRRQRPPKGSVEGELFNIASLQGLFVFFHAFEFVAIVVIVIILLRSH